MATVRQILNSKGYHVWSIAPDASVYEALELMAEKDVGALIVLENGRLAGIFSERDYARRIVLKGKTSRETPVGELMTREVFSIDPSQSIQECMHLMTRRHVRHLPVVEEDQLIGVLSIGDVVKQVIAEQNHIIHNLENYIAGRA